MGFNVKHVTKLTAVICGCLLVIVSVISFAKDALSPISAILDVYYILFGIALVCSEWEIIYVVDNFRLLSIYQGRGVFCIFLGTILLDESSDKGSSILSLAIGIVLMAVGLGYIFIGCKYGNNKEEKNGAKAGQNAQQGIQEGGKIIKIK